MAEIVDAARRHDAHCDLCWFPVAVAEVVEVEVPAAVRREEQLTLTVGSELVERCERDRLQRHRADAPLGLRALEPAVSECATDVDDSCLMVDIALLERHPLAGPQSRRGREEYRRPVARPEPRGELLELSPRLERSLLRAPTLRVVDSLLGGIGVDHSPDDCPCQHLPQRLGGLETVAG